MTEYQEGLQQPNVLNGIKTPVVCRYRFVTPERRELMACFTTEQLCEASWFGESSWLLLAFVDLSSVFLPGHDEEEEPGPDGLLRLLFIPADSRYRKYSIL